MMNNTRNIPVFLGEGPERRQIGTADVTKVVSGGRVEFEMVVGGRKLTATYTNSPWDVFMITGDITDTCGDPSCHHDCEKRKH